MPHSQLIHHDIIDTACPGKILVGLWQGLVIIRGARGLVSKDGIVQL